MNEFSTKWDEISFVGHGAGRYRVYPDHQLDFFLDFSPSGRREMILEAHVPDLRLPDLPSFKNLELVMVELATGVRIVITLMDEDLNNSFGVMCYDLAERSARARSVESAMSVFLSALGHWSDLFRRKSQKGMTRQEAMGLFGELSVLKRLFGNGVDPSLLILAWRGPDGDARDIGFNGFRIEIKTQLSTRAKTLKISSLEQLDDQDGRLHVVLNRITASNSGVSLTALVDELCEKLDHYLPAKAEFERKLELAMFDRGSPFSDEEFVLDEMTVFTVLEGFPRLVPANVPEGITSVGYEIVVDSIISFMVEWEEMLGEFDG